MTIIGRNAERNGPGLSYSHQVTQFTKSPKEVLKFTSLSQMPNGGSVASKMPNTRVKLTEQLAGQYCASFTFRYYYDYCNIKTDYLL